MAAYSLIKTVNTGDTITAVDRNNEHQNHINNNTVAGVTGDSTNVTAMQATVNPGGVGTESLATTLQGEIERLRYAIQQITGAAQWYVSTPCLPKAGGTMTGAIAMGSNKVTGLANGSSTTDAAAFGQVRVKQKVFATNSSTTSTSSSSFSATSLTLSITPSSASSIIELSWSGDVSNAATLGSSGLVTIFRNSTNIQGVGAWLQRFIPTASQTMRVGTGGTCYDSPATTSAITYTVEIAGDGANTFTWNPSAIPTYLVATEYL